MSDAWRKIDRGLFESPDGRWRISNPHKLTTELRHRWLVAQRRSDGAGWHMHDGNHATLQQQRAFTEVKPDLSLELRVPSVPLTFDLLVEFDLTARASHNRDKFLAYDAFLCGWALAHRRYQTHGTRPVVVFVCPDPRGTLTLARAADEAMTGRIGVMGTTPEHWYFPGRDHVFFATEADLHHHDFTALALPSRPPGLRERLTGTRELRLERAQLLPEPLIADGHAHTTKS